MSSLATVSGYGMVEFDPMNYDANCYDLFDVVICDPQTDEFIGEEHYITHEDYQSAIHDTDGREVFDEQEEFGWCRVWYNCEEYQCSCTRQVAYVFDHEEQ